jgi:hypothetical protein
MDNSDNKEAIHSFSEFATEDEQAFEGEKVKIDNLLNKEIIVLKFKVRQSKYEDSNSKNCVTVQFREIDDKTKKIFFTGSCVIMDLLQKYEQQLPFKTTIKKIDRYYTFT